MRSLTSTCLSVWVFIETGAALNGGVIGVAGHTQITGPSCYDLPASNRLAVATIGSVTITPQPMLLNESFAGVKAPKYGPDVPGDGANGRLSSGWLCSFDHADIRIEDDRDDNVRPDFIGDRDGAIRTADGGAITSSNRTCASRRLATSTGRAFVQLTIVLT